MDAGRSIYRRHRTCDTAPSLFALLHARDAQDRPCRHRGALRRHVHPGHGGARNLSREGRLLAQPGRGDDHQRSRRAARRRCQNAQPVAIGAIEKMSKSQRNTVDPDEIIDTYGADTVRWFMLSDSPPERDVIWNEDRGAGRGPLHAAPVAPGVRREGLTGERRFSANGEGLAWSPPALAIRKAAHQALAQVGENIERLRFNRCVAHIRELDEHAPGRNVGDRRGPGGRARRQACLWPRPCAFWSSSRRRWRRISPRNAGRRSAARTRRRARPGRASRTALLVEDEVTLPVRSTARSGPTSPVPRDADKAEIEAAVMALDGVKRAMDGKPLRKFILVPGRIVNVVI